MPPTVPSQGAALVNDLEAGQTTQASKKPTPIPPAEKTPEPAKAVAFTLKTVPNSATADVPILDLAQLQPGKELDTNIIIETLKCLLPKSTTLVDLDDMGDQGRKKLRLYSRDARLAIPVFDHGGVEGHDEAGGRRHWYTLFYDALDEELRLVVLDSLRGPARQRKDRLDGTKKVLRTAGYPPMSREPTILESLPQQYDSPSSGIFCMVYILHVAIIIADQGDIPTMSIDDIDEDLWRKTVLLFMCSPEDPAMDARVAKWVCVCERLGTFEDHARLRSGQTPATSDRVRMSLESMRAFAARLASAAEECQNVLRHGSDMELHVELHEGSPGYGACDMGDTEWAKLMEDGESVVQNTRRLEALLGAMAEEAHYMCRQLPQICRVAG